MSVVLYLVIQIRHYTIDVSKIILNRGLALYSACYLQAI